MIPMLRTYFTEQWSTLFPDRKKPRRLHFTKWSQHPEPETKVIIMAFADHDTKPLAVVKHYRHAGWERLLLLEYRGLVLAHDLRETHSPSLDQLHLATPLFCEKFSGERVIAESPLFGYSLGASNRLHHRRLAAVEQWLFQFTHYTRNERKMDDLAALLEQFRTIYALSPPEDMLCRRLDSLAGQTLPTAPAHGDFTPGNLLYTSAGIGAIDWLFHDECREILFDGITFFLSAGLIRENRYSPPAIALNLHRTLCHKGGAYAGLRKLLANLVRRLDIEPELLPMLFTLNLIRFSLRHMFILHEPAHIDRAWKYAFQHFAAQYEDYSARIRRLAERSR